VFSWSNVQVFKSAAISSRITITCGFGPTDKTVEDACGAANTRFYSDGTFRAVFCAGTALHAEIPVHYEGFLILNGKYVMGTYYGTHTAAVTLFMIQRKRYDARQVD
jgi:hypothetical protein